MTTDKTILPLLDHLCNEARNAMHSAFGLMEFQPDSDSRAAWHACLQASRSSADRLLRTVDDLRELVAGPPVFRESIEPFDLAVSVGEVATVLSFASKDKGARLVVGQQDQPVRVCYPRQAFEQMFTRVFKLVLKLSPSATIRISDAPGENDRVCVRLQLSEPAAALRLAEWMNATGDVVPQETAESALILGAMVAGNRLRALGGSVTSEEDRLAIYIQRQTTITGEEYCATHPHPLQVLIAEDCDESYALTALQMQDECLDRARTGSEAFEKVKKRRFDVIFMDIHMPGIDGYETIRKIRDWETASGNARTPIVVLSSDDLATQTRHAAQSGCSGFLRKPVRMSELRSALSPFRPVEDSTFD
jgi:CheY-like chemotaxis protein